MIVWCWCWCWCLDLFAIDQSEQAKSSSLRSVSVLSPPFLSPFPYLSCLPFSLSALEWEYSIQAFSFFFSISFFFSRNLPSCGQDQPPQDFPVQKPFFSTARLSLAFVYPNVFLSFPLIFFFFSALRIAQYTILQTPCNIISACLFLKQGAIPLQCNHSKIH